VVGDGGPERPERAPVRERRLELVLERMQLAHGRAPRAPRAGEPVPGAGEREQVGPPAAPMGSEHRTDARSALGVGAGDDRLGPHGLEHREARALGQELDGPAQVLDRGAGASHRIADATVVPVGAAVHVPLR
jgi:hypothetical protein